MTSPGAQGVLFCIGIVAMGLACCLMPSDYDLRYREERVPALALTAKILFGLGGLFTLPGLFTLWTLAIFG